MDVTDDLHHSGKKRDAGVEMTAELHHTTKKGGKRDLKLQFGWSMDQIIYVLLNLREGKDGIQVEADRTRIVLDEPAAAAVEGTEGDRENALDRDACTVCPRPSLAARTSNWIFHEAARQGANRKERTEETLQLFDRYYVRAGVSVHWLERIMPVIKRANLWQTGGDLISGNTGIVTSPLEKGTERLVPAQRLEKAI